MFVLMKGYHTEFLGFVKQQITINRFYLLGSADITWRVSDCEELVGVPHRGWCDCPYEEN